VRKVIRPQGDRMSEGPNDSQIVRLIEAVDKLTVSAEQVVSSLVKIEALYIDMLREQKEQRAEAKARQKKFDEDQEEFRKRQKRWDERDKKWEEQSQWLKKPWLQPQQIAYLFLMVAFAALAIALAIMAAR
jgi:hypothetical protein